jgi:hypothetical protein
MPLWFAIPAWAAIIAVFVWLSEDKKKHAPPPDRRSALEREVDAEEAHRVEVTKRQVQKELIRIEKGYPR